MNSTVYIRQENEKKWEAIPDKSNWINTILENSGDTSRYGAVRDSPAGPMVEVLSETMEGTCKKGHPIPAGRSRCMGKGCKYS